LKQKRRIYKPGEKEVIGHQSEEKTATASGTWNSAIGKSCRTEEQKFCFSSFFPESFSVFSREY